MGIRGGGIGLFISMPLSLFLLSLLDDIVIFSTVVDRCLATAIPTGMLFKILDESSTDDIDESGDVTVSFLKRLFDKLFIDESVLDEVVEAGLVNNESLGLL